MQAVLAFFITVVLLPLVAVFTCLLPRLLLCSCFRTLRQRVVGYSPLPSEELTLTVPFDATHTASSLNRLLPLVAEDSNDAIDAWIVPFLATSLPVLSLFSLSKFPFPLLGALHVSTTMTLTKAPTSPGKAFITWRPSDSRQTPKGVEINVSVVTPNVLLSHKYLFLHSRLPPTATTGDKQAPPAPRLEITPGPIQSPLSLPASLVTKWCELSQDYNPIHTSSILASLFGFKGRVAHGMSVVLLALRRLKASKSMTSGTLLVSFQRPIILPNTRSCAVCVGEESGGSPAGLSATITVEGKVCTTMAWTRGEKQ